MAIHIPEQQWMIPESPSRNRQDELLLSVAIRHGFTWKCSNEYIIIPKSFIDFNYNTFFLQTSTQKDVYWLIVNGGRYHDLCFCAKCQLFLNGSGSNLRYHCMTQHSDEAQRLEPFSEKKMSYFLLFLLRHQIPFNASHDDVVPLMLGMRWIPTVFNQLVETTYNELLTSIKYEINNSSAYVIMADGWTDQANRRYLGVASKLVIGSEVRHRFLRMVDCDSFEHSSQTIAAEIRKVIELFGFQRDKIISFCSDSAAVMSSAANLLDMDWDPCLMHRLNLVYEKFFDYAPHQIHSLIAKITYLHSLTTFTDFLKLNHHFLHNLKLYCRTRWMSIEDCIKSFVNTKDLILKFYDVHAVAGKYIINSEEIDAAFEVYPVIARFKEICEIINDNRDSINLADMFHAVCMIKDIINSFIKERPDSIFIVCLNAMNAEIDSRFFDTNQKSCCRMLIAGYLDVRQELETIFFQNNLLDIVIELIRDEAELFTTDIDSEDETEDQSGAPIYQRPITNLIRKGDSKPGLTSRALMLEIEKFHSSRTIQYTENLLEFWVIQNRNFPILSKLAVSILNHSVTTTFLENGFSIARRILRWDRLKMSKENANILIVLTNNPEILEILLTKNYEQLFNNENNLTQQNTRKNKQNRSRTARILEH